MVVKIDLEKLSIKEILRLNAKTINELKRRNIVRTSNNPVGDYTEWIVSQKLQLDLEKNSSSGYDGTNKKGEKFQIKGRRTTPSNQSRQLSAIRKYDQKEFDFLVAVIFDEYYEILDARLIPHKVIQKYAKYNTHQNAHILVLQGKILEDPRIKDITEKLHDFPD